MGLADAYAYTGRVMVENMLARDAEEGIGAFIGKRNAGMEGRIAMEPRISIITIAVDDLDRAVALLRGDGLTRHAGITDGVAFFQMGGAILGLFPRTERRRGFRHCLRRGAVRRLSRLQHPFGCRGR